MRIVLKHHLVLVISGLIASFFFFHSVTHVHAATFTDNFSSYPQGTCMTDGASFGSWSVVFSGFGCVSLTSVAGNPVLTEKPQVSTSASETHASLVVGPSFSGQLTFEGSFTTVKQLRTGTQPNAWEVAWIVWNYRDNDHFYYFAPKPNGWELGKRDPANTGGQRFLATGATPTFGVGTKHTFKVTQSTGNMMSVTIDGKLVTTFTDTERPYTDGKIGLYNEDAEVRFDDISASDGSVAPVPTQPSTTGDCHLIKSGDTVPVGYGAPYTFFTAARELLLRVSCDTNTITVSAGAGPNTPYVYQDGYEFKNGTWQKIRFTGGTPSGVWYVGSAQYTRALTAADSASTQYVVGYVCENVSGTWKCGCRDNLCAVPTWQLQTFRAQQTGTGGSTPAPTVTLSASKTSVTSGSAVVLAWTSTNSTSCTGTGFATGAALSGSISVTPTVNTTYAVTCTGTGGSATKSVTVTVTTSGGTTPAPTAAITSSKTSVTAGSAVTLTWASTNATNCTGTGFSTVGAPGGSVSVTPSADTTYAISCSGAGGTVNKSVTVTVTSAGTASGLMYGVTVDDIAKLTAIKTAIDKFDKPITTRIVFDEGMNASYYANAVTQLSQVSQIMGELSDSEAFAKLSANAYDARVDQYLAAFPTGITYWEVANEINGNWTGPYPTVSAKIYSAYKKVKAKGQKAAITLWYNEGCGNGASELDPIAFSNQYVPADMRAGLDLVTVSYYQTQCGNRVPSVSELTTHFSKLHALYPNAKLGFGEIGFPNPVGSNTSAAVTMINYYHGLKINVPNYVGGYFWWYFVQDMVPESKPLWSTLNTAFNNMQ